MHSETLKVVLSQVFLELRFRGWGKGITISHLRPGSFIFSFQNVLLPITCDPKIKEILSSSDWALQDVEVDVKAIMQSINCIGRKLHFHETGKEKEKRQ